MIVKIDVNSGQENYYISYTPYSPGSSNIVYFSEFRMQHSASNDYIYIISSVYSDSPDWTTLGCSTGYNAFFLTISATTMTVVNFLFFGNVEASNYETMVQDFYIGSTFFITLGRLYTGTNY